MTPHNIHLKIDKAGHVKPDKKLTGYQVGDTLSFTSDDGLPKAAFDPADVLSAATFEHGDQPLTFEKRIKFVFHCSIVKPDGETVGWAKDKNPNSGGNGEP